MGEFNTLAGLERHFKSVIEGIEKSLEFNNMEFKALEAKVKTLEASNKSLELENRSLKSQINTMVNQMTENAMKIDDLEQYTRRDSIEIKGVPTSQYENTNQLVCQVGELMDVDISEDDISISHRLPPNKPWVDNNGTQHPPSPPSIIAKFVRRDTKNEFYSRRWKLKDKKSDDIEGLEGSPGHSIYVSESLTQRRKKLFRSALKVKKDLNFQFISTTNGNIYLKKAPGTRPTLINTESDLAKLRKSHTDDPVYGRG